MQGVSSVMIVFLLVMITINEKEYFNDLCNVPEGQPWLNKQGGGVVDEDDGDD